MNNAGKPVLGENRAKRHTLRSPEEFPSQRDQIPILPKCPWLRRSSERAKFPKSCRHTNRLVRPNNQPVQPSNQPVGQIRQPTGPYKLQWPRRKVTANQPVGHQLRPTGTTSFPTGSRDHQPVRVAATYLQKKRKCTNRFTTHDQPVRQAFQPVGSVHQPVHQSLQMMIKKMTRYRALTNRFNRCTNRCYPRRRPTGW